MLDSTSALVSRAVQSSSRYSAQNTWSAPLGSMIVSSGFRSRTDIEPHEIVLAIQWAMRTGSARCRSGTPVLERIRSLTRSGWRRTKTCATAPTKGRAEDRDAAHPFSIQDRA